MGIPSSMQREDIYTEKVHGCTIRIVQDESYDYSPDEDGNEDLFLVAFHRDFDVRRKGFEEYVAALAFADRDKYTEDELDEWQKERNKQVTKEYHVFGLEAYIHSGVVLALSQEGNFPDRRWDVSQLGAVFVKKEHWKTKAQARKAALSLIEEWNDVMSGNVYGYIVEDSQGNDVDSCWRFIGDYDSEGGCLAEAREAAKYHEDKRKKEQAAKLKAYVRNNVPLEKRVAFSV